MEFGDILDYAFKIYRAHFATLFLAALIPYLPFIAVGALMGVAIGTGSDAGMVAGGVAALLSIPVMIAGFLVAWGALTHLSSEAYLGRPVRLEDGIRRGLARSPALLGTSVLATILALCGLLFFIVPMFIVMAMLFAVYSAVVIEGRGPIEALGRSRELSRGALGRIFGILLVAGIIGALPGWSLSLISELGGASPSVRVILSVLQMAVGVIAWPFSCAVYVLLYYDRRIRTEALDVQLAADRLDVPAAV